jgi:hypothetical protein
MPVTFDLELRRLLLRAGCEFVRTGKDSHEIWYSPIRYRRFPVPIGVVGRHMANAVLAQAGLPKAFDLRPATRISSVTFGSTAERRAEDFMFAVLQPRYSD